jgi:outer membrane lipoprotein-sorting protein
MCRRTALLAGLFLAILLVPADATPPPEDDPEAHALYDLMVETMRKAKTLSWTSVYIFESSDYGRLNRCVYRIWLKKPNQVRLEAMNAGEVKGVLVGDGENFYKYWPPGRPDWACDREGDRAKQYAGTKLTSYVKKRSPPGHHSIGHETGELGAGLGMPILDPSTFHGYTDSLQRYVDGVTSEGEDKVRDVECDVILVSIMKGQRTWKIWLSKEDHLPRRLVQTIKARSVITTRETWSKVRIDEEIPDDKFVWKPPEGWTQYVKPDVSEGLLKRGVAAPDFDLPLHGGGRFKLSEQRGKVVWFYLWRAG